MATLKKLAQKEIEEANEKKIVEKIKSLIRARTALEAQILDIDNAMDNLETEEGAKKYLLDLLTELNSGWATSGSVVSGSLISYGR